MNGSIVGAFKSTTGLYGVYSMNRRLFVVHNPELDATRSDGISSVAFIIDELFGTMVNTRPCKIEDIESRNVIKIGRREIIIIEMKRPLLLAGPIILGPVMARR
ncbi:MAG: hypothetical protein WCF90_08990 [Methanomicrobiales archaeon]